MKIQTGDTVQVTAGKDKGKTGKVLQVFPKLQKIVVENVNKAVKHVKRQGNNPGQRVEFNAPIHVSNVQVTGKNGIGRIGYKQIEKDGKIQKVRVLKNRKGSEDLE